MGTLARDWRLLRSLDRRKRSGTAMGRTLFVAGCFPALLGGYLILAFAFAEALPASSIEPVTVLSLGVAIIWLRAFGHALDGRGIVCARGGLTQLLSAPVSRRALVLRWAVTEALAGGLMVLGVFVFLAVLADESRAKPALLASVLPVAAGLTLAATGVRGMLGLLLPSLPAALRRVAVTLTTTGQALCAAVLIGGLLGFAWPEAIAPWSAGVAAAAEFTAAPFAHLMQHGGAAGLIAVAAGGLLGWLLPVLLAPLSSAEHLLESSDRDAERRRPPAARSRRAGGTAAGGWTGPWSPMWKVGREYAAQPGLLGAAWWLLPAAAGGLLAWFGPEWLPRNAAIPAGLIGALVLLGVPLGGRGSPGLASELEHPAWFLRYPGDRSRLLLAMLLPGVVRLVLGAGLIGLPLAARMEGALLPALAAWGATPLVVLAAHLSRALVWLSWPPWSAESAQNAVIEARVLAIPPGLGIAAGAIGWGALGFPAWLACAAGAAPALLMLKLQWPRALELWERLEMLPRGG